MANENSQCSGDIPITSSNNILGNIVERKFNERYKFDSNRVSTVEHELGFPKVFKLDDIQLTKKNTSSKRSLFRQHLSTLKSVKDDVAKVQKNESLHHNEEEESFVAKDQLAIEIHQENLAKLTEMGEAEILKEKKILEDMLDPKLIQFFKNRKKYGKRSIEKGMQETMLLANRAITDAEVSIDKKLKLFTNDNDTVNVSITKETAMDVEVSNDKKMKLSLKENDINMDYENDAVNIPKLSKEILEASKQKGWLHMDTPEPEKLKWMEDLMEEKKNEPTTNEEYNARFDFNGLLLPYKDESLTSDKGLHHHGEEPERPGYSLQELLQLSRSSIQQQRCKALTTLANIMEKTHEGIYDKVLHPSPLTALSQKNILLLLRFSLDDTSVAVVTATLQALKAFLVSEADEICLDRLHGFNGYTEPSLMPQLEDKDTSSLKDHELAQLDAVAALLRSDFLLRIRYILNEVHPPPVGVTCALEILIRLARHSHTTALNISLTPYLLDIIIQNFMPLSIDQLAMQGAINNVYGIPVVQAIKLCRVLVTYGKKPIAQKLNHFKVIHSILTYINSETGKDDLHLSIESLRLWRMLLYYEVGLESVAGTLISQLQLLLCNHDIQSTSKNELACERAAALIAVASHERSLRSNISTLLKKWNTQFSSVTNATWGVMKLIAKTLSAVDESVNEIAWLFNEHIFSRLRSSSNLLSNCNPATDREPSCLPSLDVHTENGEPQPIVSVNSCIPFFASVLKTFHNQSCLAKIRAILGHPNFFKYIRDLEKFDWSFERSWYSRTELCLLTTVVKAASLLKDTISKETMQIIWKIAIKLVSTLPADATDHVRELLKIALSNEKINLEIIVNEFATLDLAASATTDQIKIDLCSDAASLYERYIVPNDDWNQAAMPKDWLFLPLVHLYNKYKSDIRFQPEDKNSILTVLSLALILPDLTRRLSLTLRFSRLILVYLCDSVYLDKDVSVLLTKVLSNLLTKHYAQLDFQAELPGLSSFIDLFNALCEQFCANSYGDNNFAGTLLVPVAQRYDVHYRKLLWSEHAATLQYLRLSPCHLLLPLNDYFYPEEEDVSLINIYITALVRETVSEHLCRILFLIALHHSAMYLKRTNKLAVQMRTQVEKLRNKDIAHKLLYYTPLI